MSSPTQRSLAMLREDGWLAAVVEKWNHITHQRQDLFGFGDIIAVKPFPADPATIIVQTTTASNVSSRRQKILDSESARIWLQAGNGIEIHGWRKKKIKRGGVAYRWVCNREEVRL